MVPCVIPQTEMLEVCTNRFAPACNAASTTLRVPSMLMRSCSALCFDQRLVLPATWNSASTPCGRVRESDPASLISPSSSSTGDFSISRFRYLVSEVRRCNASTRQPCRPSCSTRLMPTKPLLPVTYAVLAMTGLDGLRLDRMRVLVLPRARIHHGEPQRRDECERYHAGVAVGQLRAGV